MPHEVWYEGKTEDVGEKAYQIVETLKAEQAGRRSRYTRNLELFEGRKMAGYGAHSYSNYGASEFTGENSFEDDRLLLIRSASLAACAEIYGKQKPKPQFQTLGATWRVRRKAYKLDRICEGILNQRQDRYVNVWQFMEDAGVEAALQGVACIKVTADHMQKRIVHGLRPLPDVFVDPCEGRRPRNLFDREPISQSRACKRWPKHKALIEGAKEYEWFGGKDNQRARMDRMVELVHAYHLPDGPDDPGKWIAMINGNVVDHGKWTAPSFPYVFLVWEYHRDGFWGSGIGDEGKRQARECGELDFRLMKRAIINSGNRVYVHEDAIVADEDLTGNDELTVVKFAGSNGPPQEITRVGFTEADISLRNLKIQDFWQGLGISQVSAAAQREPNIQSAIGMMTNNEIKSGRQIQKAKRYENAFVDLAHQYVWRMRELKEEDPKIAVSFAGRGIIHRLEFDSADPEDDAELTCSVAPASAMPHDPAGRQETAFTLYQMGMVSQDQYKELLGWADIENTMAFDTAAMDYFDAIIDRYLDAEEETWDVNSYIAPEGTIPNKMTVLGKFTNAMYRARLDQLGLEDEESDRAEFCIEILTRFIRELIELMKPPAPPAQAAPPGAGMAPPGAGGPPMGPGVPAAAQNAPPGALPQLAAPPKPGPQPLKAV